MRHVLATIVLTSGCVRVSELPDVGSCADYPSDTYEYGQIGVGTCLTGPNSIRFAGDAESPTLLVTNANPYKVFSGGSLLAIPWSNVDLGDRNNAVDTLDPTALALPNFAIGLEVDDGLGMIGLRESLDSRTRTGKDDVYLVNLASPEDPSPSTRGTNAGATVEVQADPVDIATDPETGFSFVANRTSQSITVLDGTGNEIEVIQPWPESLVTAAAYGDNSGANGSARMVDFNTLGNGALVTDTWTLRWVEGTWRVWAPSEEGLSRFTTNLLTDAEGTPLYEPSAMGTELHLDDAPDAVLELADPFYSDVLGRMLYSSEGTIWGATSADYLGDWSFDSVPSLRGEEGTWHAWLGSPTLTPGIEATHLFFDASESDIGTDGVSVIGTATSTDGFTWSISDSPALEPTHPHEGFHIADPFVIYDDESQLWRMFYSAHDGTTWTIGHATSVDLETWNSDDTPTLTHALGAAAPTVHRQLGRWHMWFSAWDGTQWSLAYATSPDGTDWTSVNAGLDIVASLEQSRPPRVALHGSGSNTFQVRGESTGVLPEPLVPGYSYAALAYGWSAEILAGSSADLGDLGAESNGGIRLDAIADLADGTEHTFWTVTNRAGRDRIAWTSDLTSEIGLFEGSRSGFERSGVSHPVPFALNGESHMLYAGIRNGRQSIGLATLEDGVWNSAGRVIATSSDDWDSVSIVPNSIVPTSDGVRLWYSGFDGARWRVGSARSSDGETWTRDEAPRGYQFGLGEPGSWDDSGVRDGWSIIDESGEHLWYSGFDGNTWRIGYAFRANGESSFERSLNPFTEEGRAVVVPDSGLFHRSHVTRPVVYKTDSGLQMYYAGESGDQTRVGTAFGIDFDRFNRTPHLPRTGDTLTFTTERGNEDAEAIPLDGTTDGHTTTGTGLSDLHIDSERGILFAVSESHATIFAIDIRDDTDTASGFIDRNYLDIEAILLLNTSVYATGFRQVEVVPGTNTLMALVDAPESVVSIDLSDLVDDEYGEAIYNIATGYLAAPRGNERDEGTNTMNSVGPGQMIMHPDGHRLFVSNFNRNSVTAYDIRMGPYGMPIREIRNIGENPYALAISPDGNHLVVGNYTGEVENKVAHASLGIIDINPESSTYLEAVSWIVNR